MSVLSIIAICICAAGAFWIFGSFVLRWGGASLVLMSLVSLAVDGDPIVLWLTVPAVVAWVVGHWLFSRRHGYYKSQLVETIADYAPDSRHTRILR